MAYLTRNEVIQASRLEPRQSYPSTSPHILLESDLAAEITESLAAEFEDSFDVFLSHASEDSEIVLGVREILTRLGLKVYIDWIDDQQLDRGNVTAANAEILRRRMQQSKSLIFLTTESSVSSRWMPWELGYFDGMRSGFIGILPVVDNEGDSFTGQEYIGLYPLVEKLPLIGEESRFCVIERTRKGYRFLEDFARGVTAIRDFNI